MTPYATLGGGRQPTVTLYQGDVSEVLQEMPPASVSMVCTSPPYWGLRSYLDTGHADKAQELGMEPLPFCANWERGPRCGRGCWVCAMVEVFDEVKRVLHPSGTVWCNVGDTMAGHHISGWRAGNEQKNGGHSNKNGVGTVPGIPAKNTLGLPWRLALALQAAGWWLRQDIVWAKKAPLPESVQDRCTKSHEYLFLLSKHPHYYFDQEAIKEPAQDWGLRDRTQSKNNTNGFAFAGQPPHRGLTNGNAAEAGRNKRSVWHLGPEPYAAGHFAVMPTKLVEPCILAGSSAYGVCSACGSPWRRVVERGRLVAAPGRSTSTPGAKGPSNPDNGWHETNWKPGHADGTTDRGFTPTCTCTAGVRRAVVLDPFGGSGTTALVAAQHGRDAILIDLNSRYLDLAIERLTLALAQLPLFGVGA